MEIFLDIETIPAQAEWIKPYLAEKTTPPANIKKQDSIDAWYKDKHADAVEEALLKCSFDGAMCEIVCIGIALDDAAPITFTGDEESILRDFYIYLLANTEEFNRVFVGHNITSFDMSIIRQRSIINGVRPAKGMPFDAKPWDRNPFDTMVQWDAKNMTGLDKIARALGVEAKSDVDGSMVYQMWKDGKIKEIADYCCDDVRMVREVYNKMKIVI